MITGTSVSLSINWIYHFHQRATICIQFVSIVLIRGSPLTSNRGVCDPLPNDQMYFDSPHRNIINGGYVNNVLNIKEDCECACNSKMNVWVSGNCKGDRAGTVIVTVITIFDCISLSYANIWAEIKWVCE